MRMTCCAALAMGVILFAGCGDKVTNNYYQSASFGIFGRLNPPDSGTVVALAAESLSAPITSQGFFFLNDLPPGAYHLSVYPAHHTRREMDEILVVPGKTSNLTVTISNYPYPIFRSSPSDGIRYVPPDAGIGLYTDEPLDIDDLNAKTTIDPPLAGQWVDHLSPTCLFGIDPGNDGLSDLCFARETNLRIGTIYHVTIDASVRTKAGIPLGSDCVFSFETEPLSVRVYLPREGSLGGISLWDFQPNLSFNECVDADSLARAVTFSPKIEGVWTVEYGCYDYGNDGPALGTASANGDGGMGSYFMFLPITGVPLIPQTEYIMAVDTSALAIGGLHLPYPDTTRFVTEHPGVVSVIPRHGTIVPFTNFTVLLDFNVPMDTASVEAAFELDEVGAWRVPGNFTWASGRSLKFSPLDQFRSGAAYRVNVSTAARTKDGENLLRSFVSYFRVQ